jgi:5S rRNA maturation endonuclease (ribonuclease M5)
MPWVRVSKEHRCPVCNKPDWCTVGDRFICCMRVQSPKPVRNGGWLHEIEGAKNIPLPPRLPYTPTINARRIMEDLWERTTADQLSKLSVQLGLPASSLLPLAPAWSPASGPDGAWAFPMVDAYGAMVGIRLRDDQGNKWAVKGSRQGLFIPYSQPEELLVICEGPTDTAAALSMGLYSIGRPSCMGCEDMLRTIIRRSDIRRVVILADNDEPGQTGARRLAQSVKVPCLITFPPTKDLREFVLQGGNAVVLEALWHSQVWAMPK